MTSEKIKRIAVLNDPAEAEVLRGMLEAQGIPVMLSKEGASTAYGLTAGAFGEVEVFVASDKAVEAERIFKEYFGELDEEIEEID